MTAPNFMLGAGGRSGFSLRGPNPRAHMQHCAQRKCYMGAVGAVGAVNLQMIWHGGSTCAQCHRGRSVSITGYPTFPGNAQERWIHLSDFVMLKGNVIVPVEAVRIALDLEQRGLQLRLDGDGLSIGPPDRITAEDQASIRRWRFHLCAILACAEDVCIQ